MCSGDDMTNQEYPHAPIDAMSVIEKVAVGLNGHYIMSTEAFATMLMECGLGSKDTNVIIDELVISE
jgi:hypothetical protein